MENLKKTDQNEGMSIRYYDKFSKIYDWISTKYYYRKPREFSIKKMTLEKGHIVLNVPCGTGQNFEYFQQYLANSGQVIGIDLSAGMLKKAASKIHKNEWKNIQIIQKDVTQINEEWVKNKFGYELKFDSILCDLGLSGFPAWEKIIDELITLLKPNGKIVIMDWYIDKPSLRGKFIKWIGKGAIDRPLYQYLENRVANFELNKSFKSGQVFVAVGTKKKTDE